MTESPETAVAARIKRKEWKAKRDRLFDKYLQDPSNTLLALEIKAIDDQVAESKEHEETQRRARLCKLRK